VGTTDKTIVCILICGFLTGSISLDISCFLGWYRTPNIVVVIIIVIDVAFMYFDFPYLSTVCNCGIASPPSLVVMQLTFLSYFFYMTFVYIAFNQ